MVKVILFPVLFMGFLFAGAQQPAVKSVPWQEPAQVEQKQKQSARPILIDVYTSWCTYCKLMDNTTWKNRKMAAYIAEKFYAIKFDAEQKTPVIWQGASYEFKPAYKVHMLAVKWLQGNMVYPSTVILPPNGTEPVIIPGMLTAKELEPVLTYFGDGHYLTVSWENYKSAFKSAWNQP